MNTSLRNLVPSFTYQPIEQRVEQSLPSSNNTQYELDPFRGLAAMLMTVGSVAGGLGVTFIAKGTSSLNENLQAMGIILTSIAITALGGGSYTLYHLMKKKENAPENAELDSVVSSIDTSLPTSGPQPNVVLTVNPYSGQWEYVQLPFWHQEADSPFLTQAASIYRPLPQ